MADRLKLDTVALRDAGANLRVVAQEFNDANANSDDVASSVGHPGLASCIEQFAHGWDDKRGKIVGMVTSLADSCTGIGEGFEGLDRDFAAALKGQ